MGLFNSFILLYLPINTPIPVLSINVNSDKSITICTNPLSVSNKASNLVRIDFAEYSSNSPLSKMYKVLLTIRDFMSILAPLLDSNNEKNKKNNN